MTVVDLDTRRIARVAPAAPAAGGTSAGRPPILRPVKPRPASRVVGTPAERAVVAAAAMVEPIGLKELNELAELQTRVDRKYFVPAEVFHRLIGELAGQDLPAGLRATLVTTYRRTTFVSRSGEAHVVRR